MFLEILLGRCNCCVFVTHVYFFSFVGRCSDGSKVGLVSFQISSKSILFCMYVGLSYLGAVVDRNFFTGITLGRGLFECLINFSCFSLWWRLLEIVVLAISSHRLFAASL